MAETVYLCTDPDHVEFERDNPRLVGWTHWTGHDGSPFAVCTGDERCTVTVPHDGHPRPVRQPDPGFGFFLFPYPDCPLHGQEASQPECNGKCVPLGSPYGAEYEPHPDCPAHQGDRP